MRVERSCGRGSRRFKLNKMEAMELGLLVGLTSVFGVDIRNQGREDFGSALYSVLVVSKASITISYTK